MTVCCSRHAWLGCSCLFLVLGHWLSTWCRVIHFEVCAGWKSEQGSRGRFQYLFLHKGFWLSVAPAQQVLLTRWGRVISWSIAKEIQGASDTCETQVQQTDLEMRTSPTRWKGRKMKKAAAWILILQRNGKQKPGVWQSPWILPSLKQEASPFYSSHTLFYFTRSFLFRTFGRRDRSQWTNPFPLAKNTCRVFLAKLSTPAPYPSTSWCRDVSYCISACRQGETRRPFFGGIFANFELVCAFRGRHWPYWRKRKT